MPANARIEVELCLSDAKHTGPILDGKKEQNTSTENKNSVNVDDMMEKFLQVANYLQSALEKECGMFVVEEKFTLVTNRVARASEVFIVTNRMAPMLQSKKQCKVSKMYIAAESEDKTQSATKFYLSKFSELTEAEYKLGTQVHMLARDNFSFPPFTEYLFGLKHDDSRCTAQQKVMNVGNVEPQS